MPSHRQPQDGHRTDPLCHAQSSSNQRLGHKPQAVGPGIRHQDALCPKAAVLLAPTALMPSAPWLPFPGGDAESLTCLNQIQGMAWEPPGTGGLCFPPGKAPFIGWAKFSIPPKPPVFGHSHPKSAQNGATFLPFKETGRQDRQSPGAQDTHPCQQPHASSLTGQHPLGTSLARGPEQLPPSLPLTSLAGGKVGHVSAVRAGDKGRL